MTDTKARPNAYVTREKKNSLIAVSCVFAWGVSVTLSCLAIDHLPMPKLVGLVALLVNVGIGLVAIVAFMRWLNVLDEMLRKIWIESIAITCGVLWIAFGSLIILEAAEFVEIDSVEIGLLTVLAGLGMSLGVVRTFKYQ